MATAVLLIDHYNDFLHPKGKAHPSVKESIDATGTIGNLHKLVKAARNNRIPIFHCMHQQVDTKTFQGWQMLNKSLDRIAKNLLFEKESFGAQYYEGLEPDPENGDVVVSRHWNSSAFQNTDLQYQLQQRGIRKLVLAGMVTNTCLEATARYGYELGYNLTMITDATAGFSTAQKDAATKLIWPLFANEVITVDEWVQSFRISSGL